MTTLVCKRKYHELGQATETHQSPWKRPNIPPQESSQSAVQKQLGEMEEKFGTILQNIMKKLEAVNTRLEKVETYLHTEQARKKWQHCSYIS